MGVAMLVAAGPGGSSLGACTLHRCDRCEPHSVQYVKSYLMCLLQLVRDTQEQSSCSQALLAALVCPPSLNTPEHPPPHPAMPSPLYTVEEYVGKGDILNDCISHPDKYTERHVAVSLVKPLLQALAHLHANNVIHR